MFIHYYAFALPDPSRPFPVSWRGVWQEWQERRSRRPAAAAAATATRCPQRPPQPLPWRLHRLGGHSVGLLVVAGLDGWELLMQEQVNGGKSCIAWQPVRTLHIFERQ